MRDWIELRNKLVEAHIETNSKARFRHFNRISGGKTHLIHMVVPFDSWEDYGNLAPIFSAKIFNDAHGDGEHKKWLDQISNVIEYRGKKNKILKNWSKKYKTYKIKSNYISFNDNTIKNFKEILILNVQR